MFLTINVPPESSDVEHVGRQTIKYVLIFIIIIVTFTFVKKNRRQAMNILKSFDI